MSNRDMCPQCGRLFTCTGNLVPQHEEVPGFDCRGSGQNPRNPKSDARRLWNGELNPHFDYERAKRGQ